MEFCKFSSFFNFKNGIYWPRGGPDRQGGGPRQPTMGALLPAGPGPPRGGPGPTPGAPPGAAQNTGATRPGGPRRGRGGTKALPRSTTRNHPREEHQAPLQRGLGSRGGGLNKGDRSEIAKGRHAGRSGTPNRNQKGREETGARFHLGKVRANEEEDGRQKGRRGKPGGGRETPKASGPINDAGLEVFKNPREREGGERGGEIWECFPSYCAGQGCKSPAWGTGRAGREGG